MRSIYLTKIVNIYTRESFTARVILMDMEPEKVLDDMELVQVNKTAAGEHVVETGGVIIVVK